jgi:hypothetical protein
MDDQPELTPSQLMFLDFLKQIDKASKGRASSVLLRNAMGKDTVKVFFFPNGEHADWVEAYMQAVGGGVTSERTNYVNQLAN